MPTNIYDGDKRIKRNIVIEIALPEVMNEDAEIDFITALMNVLAKSGMVSYSPSEGTTKSVHTKNVVTQTWEYADSN